MAKWRALVVLLLAAWLLVPLDGQQFRQPPPYRILVTNDDGVRAPGIAAVAQALQAIGTPVIVAPAENQSGAGHSIITSQPIFREDFTLPNGLRAIGLTATPASTMNVALSNIMTPAPDRGRGRRRPRADAGGAQGGRASEDERARGPSSARGGRVRAGGSRRRRRGLGRARQHRWRAGGGWRDRPVGAQAGEFGLARGVRTSANRGRAYPSSYSSTAVGHERLCYRHRHER